MSTVTTLSMPAPITNTARALVAELTEALRGTAIGETHALMLGVLAATLDSQWDDLSSFRDANLGLASENARLLRYIDKIETKNSSLMLDLDSANRGIITLHELLGAEADRRRAVAHRMAVAVSGIAEQLLSAVELAAGGMPETSLARELPAGLRHETDAAGEPRVLSFPPITSDATGWEESQAHGLQLAGALG